MPERFVELPTPHDVAAFTGQGDDETIVALAGAQLPIVGALVRSMTRGRGFALDGKVAEDLAAVIVAVAARMLGNPEQVVRENLGDYGVTFTPGLTLVETMVVQRYRRMAVG